MELNFLQNVFSHILLISKGECTISDEDLFSLEEQEEKRNILAGLRMLYEDLELYKDEYRKNLESEYALKILQKKNHELEQFNYMASHDLKEPLRNIKTFSELLQLRLGILPEDKIQEHLKVISDASMRMHNLIEGLLNYSVAGMSLSMTKIDPNFIIMELQNDLSTMISESQAEIHCSGLSDVYADPSSMRLIFQNLISNAIKFRKQDEPLIIKIQCNTDAKYHTFSVQDNGIGIKKIYQERIFKLLSRLHTKSEIEGTGIGLTTCQKLVELHDGQIWVESEYGKGSTFHFTIANQLESKLMLKNQSFSQAS